MKPGLAYDLWRSDEAHEYVFIERYVDDAAAQEHVKSDHYRWIGRQMGALMDGASTVLGLTAPELGAGMAVVDQGMAKGRLVPAYRRAMGYAGMAVVTRSALCLAPRARCLVGPAALRAPRIVTIGGDTLEHAY
ncbi:putative quinol monooxygenase [Paraburkholderia sp. MM5477-R1]|uniref:putative quinol monooxygenase n=1 Tax=Paraburkholderia sp. MM5477-R1 TaxID=2991062 RepID=UPI003D1D45D6